MALFKGTQETFNPQIHTEELSLTNNMNKDFAVHNKVLSKFERYNKFTSFLFHTGRVDGGTRAGWIRTPSADREIHDNAYRVKFKSLNIKPAYCTGGAVIGGWHDANNPKPDMTLITSVTYTGGATVSTVTTDMLASVAIQHKPGQQIYGDKFNPQDSFVLDSGLGTLFWIQRVRYSSTGDHTVLDCKVIGQATDFKTSSLAEGQVLMEGGNYYGEGSMRGYQRHTQDYWKIFYSFISRYSLSFTGNALDQRKVTWASPSSQTSAMKGRDSDDAMWQFEKEWEADQFFGIALELACRYSATTMDASTHQWFENFGKNKLTPIGMNPEAGITPPKISDGWIRQIKDTIDLTYDVNTGFSVALLEGLSNVLSANSPAGGQGNTYIVIGDQIAQTNFNNAIRTAIGWNVATGGMTVAGNTTSSVFNIQDNSEIKLGFKVRSYTYNDNEFIFMLDELMAHPGLNNRNGGLVGNGNMYIINVTPFDGVSNFELFSRGNQRYFLKKYVDGMHSAARGQNSMFASTGFDGAFVHYLSELFPIVYVEDSCAVIRATGTWSGGALAGKPGLNKFPAIM